MKQIAFFLLVGMVFFLFVGLLPVHGESEIYDSVVRLHVLANSDSKEDQALKLQVRDAVLEFTEPLLTGCSDREEAETILRANLDKITATAQETVWNAGHDDAVTVEFDEEPYPERSYDSFCFPSGTYLSLRVLVGEGAGQNWWCCLFPPVCRAAASVPTQEAENAFIAVGLTPDQYKIITESNSGVYRVRFKILEMVNQKKS